MTRRVSVAALAAAGALIYAGQAPARPAAAGRLVTGATSRMKWGPVTVSIRLDATGRRIVNVGAQVPTERPRSAQINGRAVPILRSEVLRAQSARIHLVSGATMTSNAYVTSLRSALTKAHL